MNPIVTANQKPTIRTHRHIKERNKSLLINKVIKPQGKKQTNKKQGKKKTKRKTTKTTRKPVVKWK